MGSVSGRFRREEQAPPLPVNEKLFGIDGRIGFGVRWFYGSSICEANMAARPLPIYKNSFVFDRRRDFGWRRLCREEQAPPLPVNEKLFGIDGRMVSTGGCFRREINPRPTGLGKFRRHIP